MASKNSIFTAKFPSLISEMMQKLTGDFSQMTKISRVGKMCVLTFPDILGF